MGKSRLIYYFKDEIKRKYVMELIIHEIIDDSRYPDGVVKIKTEKSNNRLLKRPVVDYQKIEFDLNAA